MAQNNRDWKILIHNISGINAPKKWNSTRRRITETKCDIICLQETSASILMTHISEISALYTLTNFVITRPLHLQEA